MRRNVIAAMLIAAALAVGCANTADNVAGKPQTPPAETPSMAPALALATDVSTPAPPPETPAPSDTPVPVDNTRRDRWLERVKALGLDKLDYTVNDNPILMRADMVLSGVRYGDSISRVNRLFGEPVYSGIENSDFSGDWIRILEYRDGTIANFGSDDENKGFELFWITTKQPGLKGPRGICVGDPVQKVLDAFRIEERIEFDVLYDEFDSSYLCDNDNLVVLYAEGEYGGEYLEESYGYFGRIPPFGRIEMSLSKDSKKYSILYSTPCYSDLMSDNDGDRYIMQMSFAFDIEDNHVLGITWYVGPRRV